MLAISSQREPGSSLMDSVLLKLALLFFGVFLFTYIAFLVYGVFVSSVESYALQTSVPKAAAVDDIDPKIAADLAKVLEPDEENINFAAKDPFVDRTGISKILVNAGIAYSPQQLLAQAGVTGSGSAANKAPGAPGTITSSSTSRGPSSADGNRLESLTVSSTRDRYASWAEKARYGTVGEPSPGIFSIDDLIPVGVVDGGISGEEIMFFSEAADRILSFPVGTRLFDGWIVEVRVDGVVFGTGGSIITRRLKSWGRSVKSKGSQSFSMLKTDAPNSYGPPMNGKESVAGGSN